MHDVFKSRFDDYADGLSLFGEDFSTEQIEAWFRDEAEGYYQLPEDRAPGVYAYHARNWRHGFRHLPEKTFDRVLSLGGAFGDELQPIRERIGKVTILEPAGGFQNPQFNYVAPSSSGQIPFPNETFDLVTCFGVLHHIPNVSTVIRELARCTKPGGWLLICEPTHSMGNWDHPRRLLTPHERGIPPHIIRRFVTESGLRVVHERRCMFSLTSRLRLLLPKGRFVFNSAWMTALDEWLSALPIWSQSYHARNAFQKLRPQALFLVLQKQV